MATKPTESAAPSPDALVVPLEAIWSSPGPPGDLRSPARRSWLALVGGKAANLGELLRAGFAVPGPPGSDVLMRGLPGSPGLAEGRG